MKYTLITILSFIGIFGLAQASELEAEAVLAPMTDRVVVEIAQPPEKVWAFIKRMYRDGDRYRQLGFEAVNQWMTRRVAEHHAGLEAMMKATFAREFD